MQYPLSSHGVESMSTHQRPSLFYLAKKKTLNHVLLSSLYRLFSPVQFFFRSEKFNFIDLLVDMKCSLINYFSFLCTYYAYPVYQGYKFLFVFDEIVYLLIFFFFDLSSLRKGELHKKTKTLPYFKLVVNFYNSHHSSSLFIYVNLSSNTNRRDYKF